MHLFTEITCGYPRGQHLSYPSEYYYKSKQYKLKESIQYRCERGYKETATHATCTENGWDPELLCTGMYPFKKKKKVVVDKLVYYFLYKLCYT